MTRQPRAVAGVVAPDGAKTAAILRRKAQRPGSSLVRRLDPKTLRVVALLDPVGDRSGPPAGALAAASRGGRATRAQRWGWGTSRKSPAGPRTSGQGSGGKAGG
jgi:hypothetical protein